MRSLIQTGLCLGVSLGLTAISQGALVGHWTFDEASSGAAGGANSIVDSSGGGHNATPNGGVTYTTGKVGAGALTFNGSTGYVQVNGSADTALDMAGDQYTIAWWAKTTAINSPLSAMIGNDDGQDYSDGVLVYYYPDGTLVASQNKHGGGPGDNQTAFMGYNVVTNANSDYGGLNQWVHFAITYDKTAGVRKFYVNGITDSTYPSTILTANNAGSNLTTDLYFGRYTVNNLGYFTGSLDDIRIYDTALTGGEIAQLVPEPASALLLIGGLGAFAIRRRRA